MYGMTLRIIADACGGILQIPKGQEHLADTEVTAIVTDSRKAGPGSLFAAIVGERVDGHTFIPQVFAQGAICVLSEKDVPEAGGCVIKVPSTLTALKGIAGCYRRMLGIPVVGVTGSVGKTSTKEMIASVLAQKYRVHKTKGNFNNELGLPLTIFDLDDTHEIAVLEMGISNFGEMHRLAQIARPDTCVITNIGQCHLEFLGDRDGVLRAKTEIFDFLREDGYIVLNGNDDKLVTVRNVDGIEPVFYGIAEETGDGETGDGSSFHFFQASDSAGLSKCNEEPSPVSLSYYATNVRPLGLGGIACTVHTPEGAFEVKIPIPGQHMVMNALAAAAVGAHYGLSPEQIKDGIENVEHVSGRLNVIETERFTLIDDCYNANPMSMKAALDVLAGVRAEQSQGTLVRERDLDGEGMPDSDGNGTRTRTQEGERNPAGARRVAILGDMFELGPDELALHAGVGEHAAKSGIDLLIAVGERSRSMYEAAREAGMTQAVWLERVEDLLAQTDTLLQPGDTILIKASHGMHFERIVDILL